MKAKYKVGDILTVNREYIRQGRHYFDKDLKHTKFVGKVLQVHENTNNEKDGTGEVWQNVYVFKDDISICEPFLRKVL